MSLSLLFYSSIEAFVTAATAIISCKSVSPSLAQRCRKLSSKPALPAKFWLQTSVQAQSSNSFILAHRAFVIPVELIEETWEWSKNNKFETDLFRHPNTGCMTDDHGIR